MDTRLLMMLAGAVLFSPSLVSAEVYKWVDENGQVHYSDRANAPSADKVKLHAAPAAVTKPGPSPANASGFPTTPEQQEAFNLKQEYAQRRDEENVRQLREQDEKRRLEEQRRQARLKQESEDREAARRKAVIEDCKATMRLRICSGGYDAIMREKQRLADERALQTLKSQANRPRY